MMEISDFLAAKFSTMFGAGQAWSIIDISECVFIQNNWLDGDVVHKTKTVNGDSAL